MKAILVLSDIMYLESQKQRPTRGQENWHVIVTEVLPIEKQSHCSVE